MFSLTQEGEYPYEDRVTFTVNTSQAANRTLYFRIPKWAEGAQAFVNGARQKDGVEPGKFAAVRREWKTGDRVELELPLKMRLEAIDARHADTVALVRGPLVLMTVKERQDGALPGMTRNQLLAARRVSERAWVAESASGPVNLLPFTGLGSRPYSMYVKVS
jgi:hypothetical protein